MPGPLTKFYEYADKVIDNAIIDQQKIDSDRCFGGGIAVRIITAEEYFKEMRHAPPSRAFIDIDARVCYVVAEKDDTGKWQSGEVSATSLWHSILHEKGHGMLFPGTRTFEHYEMGALQVELGKGKGINVTPVDYDERKSKGDNLAYSLLNLIQDALINYLVTFRMGVEQHPDYFGWFARQSRMDYESGLMGIYDVSKTTPILTLMEFHYRFMTALSWFYFGVDSPGPVRQGMKYGISPFRELFEVNCHACGRPFATWNWRCPVCSSKLADNNTLEEPMANRKEQLGICTNPISPLVTTSDDPDIQRQYGLLQDWFLYVTMVDYCANMPSKGDNRFINEYYCKLSEILINMVKAGCSYLIMERNRDIPRFVKSMYNLPMKIGGRELDYLEQSYIMLPAPMTLEDFLRIKAAGPKAMLEIQRQGRGDRGILTFVENYSSSITKKYKDFVSTLGEFAPADILPSSQKDIMGVFDPWQYKTPDGWEEKDPWARSYRNISLLKSNLKTEGWDQVRGQDEILALYNATTSEQEKNIMLVMYTSDNFVTLLSLIGWDMAKYVEFLKREFKIPGGEE